MMGEEEWDASAKLLAWLDVEIKAADVKSRVPWQAAASTYWTGVRNAYQDVFDRLARTMATEVTRGVRSVGE